MVEETENEDTLPCEPDPPTEEELAQQKEFEAAYEKAQTIAEEDGTHEAWYAEAAKVRTTEELVKFIEHVVHDYNHDYGTICHAVTAAAIAAAWTVNRDPRQGGITGFQAGCIMWEFIRRWMQKEGPLMLRSYKDMLYPQYDHRFDTVISEEIWEYLQQAAKDNLENTKEEHAASNVIEHWKSIAAGKVPFGYTVKKTMG